MQKLKRWYTKPSFNMVLNRIQVTLSYLEEVGERPMAENNLSMDLERLEKWTFGSSRRKEDIRTCKSRFRDIQNKRRH